MPDNVFRLRVLHNNNNKSLHLMNNNVETKIVYTGKQYEQILALSTKDYNRWEKKNLRNKGRKQCFNSLRGCIVGCASEFAAAEYSKACLSLHDFTYSFKLFGQMERRDSKNYNEPDIVIDIDDKTIGVEVKGITKGYQRSQIVPYHVDKYIKERVSKVIFVEVFHDKVNKEIHCEIYDSESPTEIKKDWILKNNNYGNPCYTNPSMLK